MNCQDFQDSLSEWTDGTLEPARCEAFCQHQDACESCREELALFESAMAAVDDAFPELEPSPLFAAKFWERIREEPAPRPGWRETLAALLRWRPDRRVALAFATFALVFGGLFAVPAVRDYREGQEIVEVAVSDVVPETRLTQVEVMPSVPDIELAALMLDDDSLLPDMQQLGNPGGEDPDWFLESL